MSVFEDWSHRWFGSFREQGDAYALCPTIMDFVDPTWSGAVREKVLIYLESAFCLVVTSRFAFPCVFEGLGCLEDAGEGMSFCVLTDGDWTWDSNLSHYVRNHHIRVPDAMVRHMGEQGFIPPAVVEPPNADWEAYSRSLPHAPFLVGRETTPHIFSPRPPRPDVAAIREAAAAAFRDHDFPKVVALYAQIERELNRSERRKMEYARDHLASASRP